MDFDVQKWWQQLFGMNLRDVMKNSENIKNMVRGGCDDNTNDKGSASHMMDIDALKCWQQYRGINFRDAAFQQLHRKNIKNMVHKESQNGLKELHLLLCKAYDDDEKCFDLALHFDLPGYDLANYISSIIWDDSMWKWSMNMWAFFVLKTIYLLQIDMKSLQMIRFAVSYKVQKGLHQNYLQFIANLDKTAKRIINHQFFAEDRKRYKYDIQIEADSDFEYDVAYRFDSEIWNDFQLCIFKDYCSEFHPDWIKEFVVKNKWKFFDDLENRKEFPSHRYLNCDDEGGIKIVDYENKNKMYAGPLEYIKHRLLSALSKNDRKNKEYRKFVNRASKFMHYTILGKIMPKQQDYPKDCSEDRKKFIFVNYFIPVRTRKIYFKFVKKCGKEILLKFLRKDCDVCGAVEIFEDTKIDKNKKYVNKMYHCRCCFLFVCSRHCQKVAWNTKPWMHRLECTKKR